MRLLFSVFSLFLFFQSHVMNSQAAILAALFGDKVASEKFNLSMEIGIPFSDYSNVENSNRTHGINFGIAGNIKLSNNWYLSPTAYFLSKRTVAFDPTAFSTGNVNLDELYLGGKSRMAVNYIDVPVLLSYQVSHTGFRIGVASQISFFRKTKIVYDGEFGKLSKDLDETNNSIDYGTIFNVGYFFKKANKGNGLIISARYYMGLNDVFKESFATGDNRASYFSVHVSLPFITDELAQKALSED